MKAYNLEMMRRSSGKLKDGGAVSLLGKPNGVDVIDSCLSLTLKSKIVWSQLSCLAQCRINYTNNYDIICYFVKGDKPRCFNLDEIRVPQLVSLSIACAVKECLQ